MTVRFKESEALLEHALPLTIEQYQKLGELGLIDGNTELLEGMAVQKVPKSPYHSAVVARLYKLIRQALPSNYFLRKEEPLSFQFSEPEPDLSVVVGKSEDYTQRHPSTGLLVIEVSISTLRIDRLKANLYAQAGIENYWLVDGESKTVEVFSKPQSGVYTEQKILQQSESIPLPWSHTVHIKVAEILK